MWFFSTQDWYDIGAIYNHEKIFQGYYCDICTPIKRLSDGFTCTDFFLDVWIYPNGLHLILDQEEYHKAVKKEWITIIQQEKIETELQALINKIKAKRFPPSKIKSLLNLPKNIDKIASVLK